MPHQPLLPTLPPLPARIEMPDELEQLGRAIAASGMDDHPDLAQLERLHKAAETFAGCLRSIAVEADRADVREAIADRDGLLDAVLDGAVGLTVVLQRWAERAEDRRRESRHGGRLDFHRWAREG